jgi:hypothetical protein
MRMLVPKALAALSIVCLTVSLAGCGSRPATETASQGGTTANPPVDEAAAPEAKAAAASVTTAGPVTTIAGASDQAAPPMHFGTGAYIFTWTGTGAFVGVSVDDSNDKPVAVLSLAGPNGQDLFAVNDDDVKPGDLKVKVSSDAAWTLKIEKVQASSATPLPQTLTADELKIAVSQPFKLEAGKPLLVNYTYKSTPKGTGTIQVVDVTTGKRLNGGLMYAGKQSDTLEMQVAAGGVYIARTTFPLASGGGDVKIAQ